MTNKRMEQMNRFVRIKTRLVLGHRVSAIARDENVSINYVGGLARKLGIKLGGPRMPAWGLQ